MSRKAAYTTGAYVSPGWGTDAPGLNAHYSRDFIPLADYGLDFTSAPTASFSSPSREALDDPA